jgi:mRNA-degrading endonuclease RelE of RelBE toxin-antitoxin system
MAYRVVALPSAEADLENLDPEVRKRILRRLVWLGASAARMVHHQLTNMPDELVGLCRLQVGDYRILYWVCRQQRELKVYRIHQSRVCLQTSTNNNVN